MSPSPYHLWHYQWDAYPRFVASGKKLKLRILFGTAREDGRVTKKSRVKVEFRKPGGGWEKVCREDLSVVDRKFLDRLDREDERISLERPRKKSKRDPRTPRPLLARPYSWIRRRWQDPLGANNRYFEAKVRGRKPGKEVEYRITVTWSKGVKQTLGPFSVVATAPVFRPKDMIGGRYGPPTDTEPVWIGHVRRDKGWAHVRVDLDDIPPGQCPVRVRVGDQGIDADPGAIPKGKLKKPYRLPLVDPFAGTVLVSMPARKRDRVVFEVQGGKLAAAQGGGRGRTRLLFSHFCIQGINDLLESPVPEYDPPRTYMQVTMYDDKGVYSSRPRRSPGQDGYRYGLANHRRFGIPYHLALNGGVLTLMAHDTPKAIGDMKVDIGHGLMVPALAGYGSHRIPYYKAETNKLDVKYCAEVQRTILGSTGKVFSPDSRVYKRSSATKACLKTKLVRYVVLDGATGYYGSSDTVRPYKVVANKELGPHLLWLDKPTKTRVLFIDDFLKDTAPAGPEYDLGKPDIKLRRRLMRFALDPRLRDINLLTYSDDFEKACGNGWFEGVPGLHERFRAFLEWVSAHPTWLGVVTTKDLNRAKDTVGKMKVRSAVDPVLDPGGDRTIDTQRNMLVFDSWQACWRDYRGRWLDKSIGQITDAVERALIKWPDKYRNRLHTIGWLAFLMALHEEAWNKQPLEWEFGDPNLVPPSDPEDFTVVSGFQSRNALVWLKASVWARWAARAGSGHDRTHVNDGPVLDAIRALPAGVSSRLWHAARDADHWDVDNYPTMVIYNRKALVVIDRNGGVVTHAFVMRGGKPVAVSGTFKSYQYKAADQVECDGPLLENTIWTPNHRYIASDLHPWSMTRTINWDEKRPGLPDPVQRRVPTAMFDHFEATAKRDGVTCRYSSGQWPPDDLNQPWLDQLMGQDGRAARQSVKADRVIWHPPGQHYTKHFTLNGTTLRVHYEDLQVGTIIDNEVCVDLYGGLMRNRQLRREHTDRRSVTITDSKRAVRIAVDGGGTITSASRLTSDRQARLRGMDTEYLQLHRVLTEAVQIRSTDPCLDYHIELDAKQ